MKIVIFTSFSLLVSALAFTYPANNRRTYRIRNEASKYVRAPANWAMNSASSSKNDMDNIGTCEMESIYRDADAIFSIVDSDGNGSISRRELTKHLTAAGYTYAVVNSIFDKLDINRNGKISRKEFREGFIMFSSLRSAKGMGMRNYDSEFKKQIYQNSDEFFQSVDIDGNGEIDLIELKANLRRKFSKKAIGNIFEILDINGDERISKEELRDAFLRYSALRLSVRKDVNIE